MTVAVFPNDQLANGNASRGIEMIASGSVDLAAYATCTLAVIDEKLPVATIPWIFEDYDEAAAVIDSTGKDYYAERLAAKGMTYLGSFHNGFASSPTPSTRSARPRMSSTSKSASPAASSSWASSTPLKPTPPP